MYQIIFSFIAAFNFLNVEFRDFSIINFHAQNSEFDSLAVIKTDEENNIEEDSFFGKDSDSDDNNSVDIIQQLQREEAAREEALKPDLESLGLDELEPSKPKEKAESKPDIKEKKPEEKLPDIALPEATTEKKTIEKKSIKIEPAEKVVEESPKENPEEKSVVKRIKNIFNKEKEEEKTQVKEIEPKAEEKVKNEQTIKELQEAQIIKEEQEKKAAQELEKAKKEEEKRQAELKRQEEIRQRKLKEIRQKYVDGQYDENFYRGIDEYHLINKIVPKEKSLVNFKTQKVAPPILNRIRGQDNRHHPFIMNYKEKVDFIFEAIEKDDINRFNSLHSLLQKPDLKNSHGDTLLTFAILMRKHDIILSALSKGADPNLANDLGYTPMNIAIEMSDYKTAKILVDMGADVHFVDALGRTYLMQATYIGSLPIVDLLIQQGIDINKADQNGVTALSIAYRNKQEIIAKYLEKYDAKSWVPKSFGNEKTPMIDELFNKWR